MATAPQSPEALASSLVEALAQQVADRAVDQIAERIRIPAEPDPWLDVEAAARYLACEPHRIYDLAAAGKLRCAKDGRRSLFRREWLDQVLEEGEG